MCSKPIGGLTAFPIVTQLAVAHCSELWKATKHATRKGADLASVLIEDGEVRRVGWFPKQVEQNGPPILECSCQSEGVLD
jgi:hypothetical protein